MDTAQTRRLIKSMLDSGKLTPETRDEFKEYLDELAKGPLDAMDADYVHSLAQRLGFAGGGAKAVTAANDDDADGDDDVWAADDDDWAADDDSDDDAAQEEIAALRSQIEEARAAVDKARYWVTQIERLPQGDGEGGAASSEGADMVKSLKTVLDDAATALSERQ